MDVTRLSPSGMDAAERAASIESAAARIAGGEAALAPDARGTVLLASADYANAAALAACDPRVLDVPDGSSPSPLWLAFGSAGDMLSSFGRLPGGARRALRRFAPGPITWHARAREAEVAGPGEWAPARWADAKGRAWVSARAMAGLTAARLADRARAQASGPIVGVDVLDADGGPIPSWRDALSRAEALGLFPGVVVEEDARDPASPPAVAMLEGEGRWRMLARGPLADDEVIEAPEFTVLFVCTGNTCRSPMAEAIARHIAPPELRVRVMSAGVSAGVGSPITDEAARALRAMGVEPPTGGSRPVTDELLREADVIYTMTAGHLAHVVSWRPDAAEKSAVLDPDGRDVADPIGMGPSVYEATSASIRSMIERRLEELAR